MRGGRAAIAGPLTDDVAVNRSLIEMIDIYLDRARIDAAQRRR